MKHTLLAGAASLALIVSFAPAMAQTAQTQDEKQKTEQAAPRATTMPKAQQGEAPRSAQEAPKSAQTDERQTTNGEVEKGVKRETSTPRQAAEPSRTPETNQRAQTEQRNDQRADEQKNDQRTDEQKNDQRAEQSTDTRKDNEQRNTIRTGESERGEPHIIGNVRTSTEHATRVTEILRTTARSERVNIAINVGVRVPAEVAIYPVPREVIAIAPEYRGYSYFVDNDQVVFVSPETHEIVGAIAYGGPGGGQMAASEEMHGARPCPAQD